MSNASPVQPQLLSRINEALVLRTIRQHGPSTRGEISQHMGVTFPTVAKAVSSLLESRLLEEYEDATSGPGRPAKRLRLSKDRSRVVGVTIDVDTCEVASAGFDGMLRDGSRKAFRTPRKYETLLAEIVERVTLLGSAHMPLLCIGVSVAGLVDYRRQEVRLVAKIPFLGRKALGYDLSQRLGVDCVLVHDSHALCLAEYVYGHANNLDTFAVLDVGTGVGFGVMINGLFLTGHSGFAGEMGHTPAVPGGRLCSCGRHGCLETVASDQAFMERMATLFGRPVEFTEVVRLATSGDVRVRTELDKLCEHLAVALAQIVNLFDPEVVYLHGRLFKELPWLQDQLVARTRKLALEPALEDCTFHHTSGSHLLGAVATAISAVSASRVNQLQDALTGIAFSVTRNVGN